MYIFIGYVAIIATILALILSQRFRVFFVAVVLSACFIYGAFAMRNAIAEEKTRTAFIVGFDLSKDVFILEDEDGYQWDFYLEEDYYSLEDEYILHLPEDEEPYYEVYREVK